MVRKRVLIVDNGTQYMGELKGKVKQYSGKRADVDTVNVSDVKSKEGISDYDAIILSGSTHRGHKNTSHKYILDNAKEDAYILGVCHGHQSLAYVEKEDDVIGSRGKINIYKRHKYAVTDPGSLEAIAQSEVSDSEGKKTRIVEAMKHPTKNIYTIQGHPEKGGDAEQILYRLLDKAYQKKAYHKAA